MNPNDILDKVMTEEYGPHWKKGGLQWRHKNGGIEVFTVGKWRYMTHATKRDFQEDAVLGLVLKTATIKRILYTLRMNGGFIRGIGENAHSFYEVRS